MLRGEDGTVFALHMKLAKMEGEAACLRSRVQERPELSQSFVAHMEKRGGLPNHLLLLIAEDCGGSLIAVKYGWGGRLVVEDEYCVSHAVERLLEQGCLTACSFRQLSSNRTF
jgi:hypothetical protein